MNRLTGLLLLFILLSISSCTGSQDCTESVAYDKMMALNRESARVVGSGAPSAMAISLQMSKETGEIAELIAAKKLNEACAKADEMAKGYNIDLKEASKGMLTYDQLAKDGGKSVGGVCSLTEAAQKQMAVHNQLQDKVNKGQAEVDVFKQFNADMAPFSEMFTSNPSEVCKQLDKLKIKYNLP
jgi:capsule polysaccharide export protein KpsE/RkpR